MAAAEYCFDGLVGPTHHYGGLSSGNLASIQHRQAVSNPRAAALQGLGKMRAMWKLGLGQAILLPHERPHIATLRALGFSGSDANVIQSASRNPKLLSLVSSASAMWTANAATCCPSSDSNDGKVHLTPANLVSKFHRTLEPAFTTKVLRRIFPDVSKFQVHDALPAADLFGDEGSANHTRFCSQFGQRGVQFFVYGRSEFDGSNVTTRFVARQTLEASQAVARRHGVSERALCFARQNETAIDAGVFHNDVISVGHAGLFLYHEKAFHQQERVIAELCEKYAQTCAGELVLLPVLEAQVSLQEAVKSYLFNSQFVTKPNGDVVLVCAKECDNESVRAFLDTCVGQGKPIREVLYLDLRESMRNGGGPACLRLRVVLTPEERSAAHGGVFVNEAILEKLERWVTRFYREKLSVEDLADPQLLIESREALDALTQVLNLGSLYPFQSP